MNFTIYEKLILGKGNFGIVYEGLLNDNIKVAVKKDIADNNKYIMNEIKILEEIKPSYYISNINMNNINYIIMYFLGPTLDVVLKKKLMDLSDHDNFKKIIFSILKEIKKIHIKGYIHRDIKPGNIIIMLDEENFQYECNIIDFGLTTLIDTVDTGRKGTTKFMSLNAHLGRKQSIKDDLYSLGYSILFLKINGIYWNDIKGKDQHDKNIKIYKMKKSFTNKDLCKRFAPNKKNELLDYFNYLDKLVLTENKFNENYINMVNEVYDKIFQIFK